GGAFSLADVSWLAIFERLQRDDGVRAVVIDASRLRAGWATLQTLRRAVAGLRESGKKVILFLEDGDNALAYLAGAADRVIMPPSGTLQLTGLRAEVLFLQGILEKARVQPEFVRLGDYKSAVEPFTRKSLSPPARDALESILDDLYDQLVSGIAEGRGLSSKQIRALIDAGPYRAGEAKAAGLIDETLYEDELEDYLAAQLDRPAEKIGVVEADVYSRFARPPALPPGARVPFPRIALILAEGLIRTGRARPSQVGRSVGATTFCDALRHAREDDRISAIVVRVDSPGGSGLASDLIWREVKKAREKKPVVVSMGDVAASGGYYLAMPADWILAEPGTITGSIGVIAGKFSLRGLYDALGLVKETIDRGERAGAHSDYRPFTKEEKKKLQAEVEACYDDFVTKAADGRGMAIDAMQEVAQGRVWTGKQALSHRLVDELGGITEAISAAKSRAEIPTAQPVSVEVLPRHMPAFLSASLLNPLRAIPSSMRGALETAGSASEFREGEPLALWPFTLKIF
ncbi:MAG: signal peptide peptidase SppA, partial [Myxococcota bacterium]